MKNYYRNLDLDLLLTPETKIGVIVVLLVGIVWFLSGKNKIKYMEDKIAIDQLLKSFTGKDDLRPVMKTPSLVGEFVYATNAHCLIKVPVSCLSGQYSEITKLPDCERVIKDAPLLEEPLIIKTILLDETLSLMPLVDEFQQCHYCEGEGERQCDLGHVHECEECKDGFTKTVIGKTYQPFDLVKINDCYYDPKYIKLISKSCEAHKVEYLTAISMMPNRALIAKIKDSTVLIMPTMFDEEKYTAYDIFKEKTPPIVSK